MINLVEFESFKQRAAQAAANIKLALAVFVMIAVATLAVACSPKAETKFSSDSQREISALLDYADAQALESALNAGENPVGKNVKFEITKVAQDSYLGFNLYAGEHLNFVSQDSIDVKAGESITVRITTVKTYLGSWVIEYVRIPDIEDAADAISNADGENTTESNSDSTENNEQLTDDKSTEIPTEEPTKVPTEELTQKPTATPQTTPENQSYVLNTATKKFHKITCNDIGRIKDSNKKDYSGKREELISQGYSPCGHCHP